MCRTGRPGITVFSQSAHTCMPGSSDSTRPTRISAFLWPAATWSRAWSTDSHSRTSPATMASTSGSSFSDAWIGVDRQQPDAAHARLRVADDADAAAGAQALRDRADQGVHGQRPARRTAADRRDWYFVQPIACARPTASGSGSRSRQWSLSLNDHQLVLVDERVLGREHGIRRSGRVGGGPPPGASAAPAASARPSWRRTSAGS